MQTSASHFMEAPHSRLGKWSAGLMILFVAMYLVNAVVLMPTSGEAMWHRTIMPVYGVSMILCGITAGVTGTIAVIRQNERSWVVWLAILPGLFMLFLLIGEFIIPH